MDLQVRARLLVLALACLAGSAPAANGAGPASRSASRPLDVSVTEVRHLVDQLNDPDPDVRRRARLIVLNLDGDALETVENALKRDDLGPSARHVLETAVSRLKPRAARIGRAREEMEWSRRTSWAQYQRVGRRDAKWDDTVRAGMDQFQFADAAHRAEAHNQFRKALDAGCDDPFVLYLEARTMSDAGADYTEVSEHMRRAAEAMAPSNYDAARKMLALYRCYQYLPDSDACRPDAILKLATEAGKLQDTPANWIEETLDGLMKSLTASLGREAAFNKIAPAYEQALPGRAAPLLFKGRFYIEWAWDARGNGFANTVTPEGWKLFRQRLDLAATDLQHAWKLDPSDGRIAEELITCMAGKGDSDAVEEWFKRAIDADPDNYGACHRFLWFLYPRWFGSHERMLELGQQCAKTDNYFGGIPYILLDAHAGVAEESGDPGQYLKRPEVWADISKIYEADLVVHPNAFVRGRYAMWAIRCGHWEVANRQFEIVGDQPDLRVFPSRAAYEEYRRHARKLAGAGAKG